MVHKCRKNTETGPSAALKKNIIKTALQKVRV